MNWVRMAIEFAIIAGSLALCMWWAYRQGYRAAMRERLEDLAKNARHEANQARAKADVLERVLPPRVRQVRITGRSRQGRND